MLPILISNVLSGMAGSMLPGASMPIAFNARCIAAACGGALEPFLTTIRIPIMCPENTDLPKLWGSTVHLNLRNTSSKSCLKASPSGTSIPLKIRGAIGISGESNRTSACFCSSDKRRGLIFSWSSSKARSAIAARSRCLARSISTFCCAALASSAAFWRFNKSFTVLPAAISSVATLLRRVKVNSSCTSPNCFALVTTFHVAIPTAIAAMAATARAQSIALFHQSTFWLSAWARSIKDWISGTFSTSDLAALAIIVGCCCVMVGIAAWQTIECRMLANSSL